MSGKRQFELQRLETPTGVQTEAWFLQRRMKFGLNQSKLLVINVHRDCLTVSNRSQSAISRHFVTSPFFYAVI